eukprot:g2538.t1
MPVALVCLFLLPLLYRASHAAKDPNTTLIHEWPMLMAHDAATTYLKSGLFHPVDTWAKTQPSGGLPQLLKCGARAFDWRPILLSNGTLAMHHGLDIIEKSMEAAIDEMLAWADAQNATAENLIVLGVTDCTCQDKHANPCTCQREANAFLRSKSIPYLTAVDLQRGVTVSDAVKLGARSGAGASAVAISSWVENYESRVTCSGYLKNNLKSSPEAHLPKLYTCYADSPTKALPLNRMYDYITNVTKRGPNSARSLSTVQALWQEDAASVAIGALHGSSLLKDEVKSELNSILTQRIKDRIWNVSQIGIIEVNNICDGGLDLLTAFREFAGASPVYPRTRPTSATQNGGRAKRIADRYSGGESKRERPLSATSRSPSPGQRRTGRGRRANTKAWNREREEGFESGFWKGGGGDDSGFRKDLPDVCVDKISITSADGHKEIATNGTKIGQKITLNIRARLNRKPSGRLTRDLGDVRNFSAKKAITVLRQLPDGSNVPFNGLTFERVRNSSKPNYMRSIVVHAKLKNTIAAEGNPLILKMYIEKGAFRANGMEPGEYWANRSKSNALVWRYAGEPRLRMTSVTGEGRQGHYGCETSIDVKCTPNMDIDWGMFEQIDGENIVPKVEVKPADQETPIECFDSISFLKKIPARNNQPESRVYRAKLRPEYHNEPFLDLEFSVKPLALCRRDPGKKPRSNKDVKKEDTFYWSYTTDKGEAKKMQSVWAIFPDSCVPGAHCILQWKAFGPIEFVDVMFSGPTNVVVDKAIPAADGSYTWEIPRDIEPGEYKIIINDTEDSTITAESKPFIIELKSIDSVTIPDSCEPGSACEISWQALNVRKVNISCAGPTGGVVAESVVAQRGGFTWNVPEDIKPGSYRIIVADAEDPTVNGEAEHLLEVLSQVKSIDSVTIPDSCEPGSACEISWQALNVRKVNISCAGPTGGVVAESVVAQRGGFTWNVPEDIKPGSYRIIVADAEDPTVNGEADRPLQILKSECIECVTLHGSCQPGGSCMVTWKSSKPSGCVKIIFSHPNSNMIQNHPSFHTNVSEIQATANLLPEGAEDLNNDGVIDSDEERIADITSTNNAAEREFAKKMNGKRHAAEDRLKRRLKGRNELHFHSGVKSIRFQENMLPEEAVDLNNDGVIDSDEEYVAEVAAANNDEEKQFAEELDGKRKSAQERLRKRWEKRHSQHRSGTIVKSTPAADGKFVWKVPGNLKHGTLLKISVADTEDHSIRGESEPFRVVKKAKSIDFVNIHGNCEPGHCCEVTWSSGNVQNVRITYSMSVSHVKMEKAYRSFHTNVSEIQATANLLPEGAEDLNNDGVIDSDEERIADITSTNNAAEREFAKKMNGKRHAAEDRLKRRLKGRNELHFHSGVKSIRFQENMLPEEAVDLNNDGVIDSDEEYVAEVAAANNDEEKQFAEELDGKRKSAQERLRKRWEKRHSQHRSGTIVKSTPAADGKFVWKVPGNLKHGTLLKISVADTEDHSVRGESELIRVQSRKVKLINCVTVPRSCKLGSCYEVTWKAQNIEYVSIACLGPTGVTVAESVPAARGIHTFNVPEDFEPGEYKITIKDNEDLSVKCESAPFFILGLEADEQKSIYSVIVPHSCSPGSSCDLRWKVFGPIKNVKILYSGPIHGVVVESVSADVGHFTWYVPEEIEPGEYKIFIQDSTNKMISQGSKSLTIRSPYTSSAPEHFQEVHISEDDLIFLNLLGCNVLI